MKHRNRYVLILNGCTTHTIIDVDETPARIVCHVPTTLDAAGQFNEASARDLLGLLNREDEMRRQVEAATPPGGAA